MWGGRRRGGGTGSGMHREASRWYAVNDYTLNLGCQAVLYDDSGLGREGGRAGLG